MHRIEAYGTLAIIFIVIISILYLPILLFLKKKGKGIIRQLSYLALFCSAFLILFATILFVLITNLFTPYTFILGNSLNLVPFQWLREADTIKQFIEGVIPNIIMFIPLGVFIPVVFEKMRKLYKTALIIFLVTFGVEFFQYFIGRSSDIDDLIANLLGGIIGYGIFKIFNYLFKDKKLWNKFIGKDLTI